MNMKFLTILASTFLVCTQAFSQMTIGSRSEEGQERQRSLELFLGFGPSVPQSSDQSVLMDPRRISRAPGGELLIIDFSRPKMIDQATLVSYSSSGYGRILSRKAVITQTLPDGVSKIQTDAVALYEGGKAYDGIFQIHEPTNRVILGTGHFVRAPLQVAVTRLVFQLESYDHDDSSVMIHLQSPEGFIYSDYKVSRQMVSPAPAPAPVPTPHFLNSGVYREQYPNPQGFADLAIRTSGNVLYISEGQNSFSMTCTGARKVCYVRNGFPNQCRDFRMEIINPREFYWVNPCRNWSGIGQWLHGI